MGKGTPGVALISYEKQKQFCPKRMKLLLMIDIGVFKMRSIYTENFVWIARQFIEMKSLSYVRSRKLMEMPHCTDLQLHDPGSVHHHVMLSGAQLIHPTANLDGLKDMDVVVLSNVIVPKSIRGTPEASDGFDCLIHAGIAGKEDFLPPSVIRKMAEALLIWLS